MFESGQLYIPPEAKESRIITRDTSFFGTSRNLSKVRNGMELMLHEPTIDFNTLREVLSINQLQDILNQRTDRDVELFSVLMERAIQQVTDTAIDDLSSAELSALIRTDSVPNDMLVQYANMQFHRKADERAAQLGTFFAESNDMPDMLRANMQNLLGSLYSRHGDIDASVRANSEGLALIVDDSGPNNLWQRMKIEHGIAVGNKDVEALQRILEARIVLNDQAHIGRTHLDIARLVRDEGNIEEALYHYRLAYEQMMHAKYHAKAVDAQHELELLIESDRTHHTVVPELPYKKVETLDQESEKRFEGMQQPASMLIKVGDTYMFAYDRTSEQYRPILVDQKRRNGSVKEIRSALAKRLNQLHAQLSDDAKYGTNPVKLKTNNTLVSSAGQYKQLSDDRKHFLYTTILTGNEHEVFRLLGALALDKQQELGYVCVDNDILLSLEAVDADLGQLIESEQAFLDKKLIEDMKAE